MKKLIENLKLYLAMLLGWLKLSIQNAFKNTYVNLASVALAVIFGFIADGLAFGFLFVYFILWMFIAEKPKKKIT